MNIVAPSAQLKADMKKVGDTMLQEWLQKAGADAAKVVEDFLPIVAILREQYHLNDPFLVQYWYYITGLLGGDFGTTFAGVGVDVRDHGAAGLRCAIHCLRDFVLRSIERLEAALHTGDVVLLDCLLQALDRRLHRLDSQRVELDRLVCPLGGLRYLPTTDTGYWLFPGGMDHHKLMTGSRIGNDLFVKFVRRMGGSGTLRGHSGMRYALFAMAEYINVITLSGLAVTLFFGGWMSSTATP